MPTYQFMAAILMHLKKGAKPAIAVEIKNIYSSMNPEKSVKFFDKV